MATGIAGAEMDWWRPHRDRRILVRVTLLRSEPEVQRHERDAFERIYVDSFPKAQREPLDALLSSIASGRSRFLVAREAGKLAGYAIFLPIGRGLIYLEYLAVDRSLRGLGLGTQLMRHLRDLWTSDTVAGAVWEVESDEAGPAHEQDMRARRIRFYRACGAQMVPCALNYRTPSLDGGPPLDMKLMWLPLAPDHVPLDGPLLRWTVETLLTTVYGLRGDDPLVEANLTAIAC
jgi:ribosomal protein S18 acetylase RimI-like enzyme